MGARDRRHRARLIRRIRRAGLGETITRTGYVPDGEVAAWFGLAAGVVLPYRAAEQSGVEALALSAGVPALTSSAGGLAELSADARWTFPPRAPARLAETLKDFLTTTAGREPPAQSGPSAAGIATIAAATLDLYRAVRAAEPASVSDVS
jgi:glycosyltransferase involved in cell wall biosynthesis